LLAIIRPASEPEVVQYWLEREYAHRGPVRDHLDVLYGDETRLIDLRNFEDHSSNAIRLEMLEGIRWFFTHFRDTEKYKVNSWNLERLDESDLSRLVLINAGDRREMSGGTLSPLDAARQIEENVARFGGFVRQDAEFIREHAETLALEESRIIIVGPETGPLTVVDGVHRLTAVFLHYFVRKQGSFNAREVYHGVSRSPYDYQFD
jgi:hypothetical protein